MSQKKQERSRFTMVSKVLIGIGLGLALLTLWQVFLMTRGQNSVLLEWSGIVHNSEAELQYPALVAVGINLVHTEQRPMMNEEQALFLASHLQPEAATKAERVEARFALLDYAAASRSSAHAKLHQVPAWLVWYQHIPLEATLSSVDPTPFPQSHHDLYLFLDDRTGHEVLSVWA